MFTYYMAADCCCGLSESETVSDMCLIWDSCRPSHWSWVTQTQKSRSWEIKMTIPRVTYFLMLLALKMSLPEHLTLDGNLTHHTTQLTKWIIPARTEFSVITYVLLPYTHMHIRIPSKRWLYLLCWRGLALLFSHKSPVDLLLGRRHYTAFWLQREVWSRRDHVCELNSLARSDSVRCPRIYSRHVLALYKPLIQLQRQLPAPLDSVGKAYIRDEFRQHK